MLFRSETWKVVEATAQAVSHACRLCWRTLRGSRSFVFRALFGEVETFEGLDPTMLAFLPGLPRGTRIHLRVKNNAALRTRTRSGASNPPMTPHVENVTRKRQSEAPA